jgi:hypothetical protein
MARAPVSKTEHFPFLIKEHSEKTPKFSPSSINRLGRVSECPRQRFAAARPRYDSEKRPPCEMRNPWKPNAASPAAERICRHCQRPRRQFAAIGK